MPIIIPHKNKIRALFLIDIQEGFLNDRNRWILPNIEYVIKNGNYALFVASLFYAPKDSLWDKQLNWTFPLQSMANRILEDMPRDTIWVKKVAKSIFKGDINLLKILQLNGIEEIHIVGLDINDCVLATAYEAFDLNFQTYILEECVESSEGEEFRNNALSILRNNCMTNASY